MSSAVTVAVARPSGARQQPQAQRQQGAPARLVAARALSLPLQQPGGALVGPVTYSGAYPSCPWPQAAASQPSYDAAAASQPSGGGIWALLTGVQGEVPAQCTATLPPEVERLMRFTDAPQLEEEQPQGWLRFWRYQGP